MEKRVQQIKKMYKRYVKKVAGFLKETFDNDILSMISWLKYMDSFNQKNDTYLKNVNINYNDLDNMYGLSSILDEENTNYRLYFIYDVLKSAGVKVYYAEGTLKDENITSSSALFVLKDDKIYCYKDDLKQLIPLRLDLLDKKIVFDLYNSEIKKMEFDITLFAYINDLNEEEMAFVIGTIYKYQATKKPLKQAVCRTNDQIVSSLFLMNLNKLGFEIREFYNDNFLNKELKR